MTVVFTNIHRSIKIAAVHLSVHVSQKLSMVIIFCFSCMFIQLRHQYHIEYIFSMHVIDHSVIISSVVFKKSMGLKKQIQLFFIFRKFWLSFLIEN